MRTVLGTTALQSPEPKLRGGQLCSSASLVRSRCSSGEVAQPLGGAKQRAVLAILILHRGELVSGERLADELWGERPARDPRPKTLQGYISRLRKALGEDVLRTRGRGTCSRFRLGGLDLDDFERLAADGRHALSAGDAATAAERLRGALGLFGGDRRRLNFTDEPFAQAECSRLEEARLASLEDRIEADIALGRDGQLVAELERPGARAPGARAPPRPADAVVVPRGPPGGCSGVLSGRPVER